MTNLIFAIIVLFGAGQAFAAGAPINLLPAADPRCENAVEVAAKTAKDLEALKAIEAMQGDAPAKKGLRLIPQSTSEGAVKSYRDVYVRMNCGTSEQFFAKIEAKNRTKPMTAKARARLCEQIVSSMVLDNMVGRVSGDDSKESRANSKRLYGSSLYEYQVNRCGNEQDFQVKIKTSLARMLASMNLESPQASAGDRNSYSRVNYIPRAQTFGTSGGTQ